MTLVNLTLSPNDILLYQNQVYLADSFMTQYVNVLLLVAIFCTIGGFGTALLVNDVIKPWLVMKYIDYQYGTGE